MPDDFQQRLENLDRQAFFLKRCILYGLVVFSFLMASMLLTTR